MRIIAKKLSGAKKAWKTFTTTCIQSKLYNLDLPRPKKYAARLLTCVRAVTRRLLNVSWKRLPRGRRGPPGASFKTYYSAVPQDDVDHQQFTRRKGAFAAIYVDKLYTDPGASVGETETTSKGKEVVAAAESSGDGGCSVVLGTIQGTDEKREWSLGDAWKAASREFRGVDERAEEFISKFHKNVEIEKEKSILDFHDMLQRSA